jgi:hypothetical protein
MPVIPDFTDRFWQQSRSKVQLVVSILDGKDRLMPANRGLVSEALAPDLVAYVRTFAFPVVASAPAGADAGGGDAGGADLGGTDPGDFGPEFNKLVKQFNALKRQAREAAPAPAAKGAAPTGAPPASVAASLPLSDRPFTPDDVARGRELFLGRRALANGGPACVACHAVHAGGETEGGRLGPDLTKCYERLGGRTALTAQLQAPATPTMLPTYQQHRLEPEEAMSLAAYLERADKTGVADASPFPLKFFLFGLGGAVLGLAAVSTFWGSRSRPPDWAAQNGRAAPALPAARPDLAPVSADYVGSGL